MPEAGSKEHREKSRKQMQRTHTCRCGRKLRGNGALSSHTRRCPVFKGATLVLTHQPKE